MLAKREKVVIYLEIQAQQSIHKRNFYFTKVSFKVLKTMVNPFLISVFNQIKSGSISNNVP